MRVSTNMMYQRGVRSLQNANERLDTANQQLTTGNKFSSAGDDPVGMSQAQSLSTKIALYNQYNNNGGLLNSSLSLEETSLTSVNTSLSRAYTLMQQANSGALSSTDRASVATSLSEIQKQLLDLMNSKNADGEYIYGGNQSQTAPFVFDSSSGQYNFQGDTGQRQIQVSPSVTIPSNDSGQDLFQAVTTDDPTKKDNILNTLSNAISVLNDPTSSGSVITDLAAKVETHLTNAMNVVNTKLGEIGGRMNTLDDVMSSNSSLGSIATEAKANVSEVDMYAAISKVSQEQNSLTVAQQAYTKISKASLFDYL